MLVVQLTNGCAAADAPSPCNLVWNDIPDIFAFFLALYLLGRVVKAAAIEHWLCIFILNIYSSWVKISAQSVQKAI